MVAEILARPLFSATRRPPPHSDSPTGDSALSDTRLTGIVTEPGYRFAIFAPNGAKALIVHEGDTVSGWRVENITPTEVSLTGPEGTKDPPAKERPEFSADFSAHGSATGIPSTNSGGSRRPTAIRVSRTV